MFVEEDLAGFQDVGCFVVVEADGFDVVLQAVFAEGKEGGGGVGNGKEAARGFVHAFIGRLRREDDGDEQLKGTRVFEFGGGMRVGVVETAEGFGDGGGGHGGFVVGAAMSVYIHFERSAVCISGLVKEEIDDGVPDEVDEDFFQQPEDEADDCQQGLEDFSRDVRQGFQEGL